MSLRSAIRAHVLLARLGRNSRDNADIMRSARAYFELARRTIHPAGTDAGRGRRAVRDRKIRPGARARARRPAAAGRRRVAQRRPAQAAISRSAKPTGCPKAPTGRRLPSRSTKSWCSAPSRFSSQGHSVVVDAVFAREAERNAIRDAARRLNVRFVGLFLVTDLATRQRRVGRREERCLRRHARDCRTSGEI